MADKKDKELQPIIIKKIKKGGDGHHGGAWKVAYADFVTAMMAFFLLLWLLNVTTQQAKDVISNYFDPTHPKVSQSTSGAGGVMGGISMSAQGAMATQVQPLTAPQATGKPRNDGGKHRQQNKRQELEKKLKAAEDKRFEEAKKQIEKALQESEDLKKISDQVKIDITPEGLRIQIIDKEGRPLFPSGSAEMYDYVKILLAAVTAAIIPLPNEVSVRGHTDSVQYAPGAKYTNWELSADRANSTRRMLMLGMLHEERIVNVMGKADREPLIPENPKDPQNRRLTVMLLRETLEQAAARGGLGDEELPPKEEPEEEYDEEAQETEAVEEEDFTNTDHEEPTFIPEDTINGPYRRTPGSVTFP